MVQLHDAHIAVRAVTHTGVHHPYVATCQLVVLSALNAYLSDGLVRLIDHRLFWTNSKVSISICSSNFLVIVLNRNILPINSLTISGLTIYSLQNVCLLPLVISSRI